MSRSLILTRLTDLENIILEDLIPIFTKNIYSYYMVNVLFRMQHLAIISHGSK